MENEELLIRHTYLVHHPLVTYHGVIKPEMPTPNAPVWTDEKCKLLNLYFRDLYMSIGASSKND